MVLVLFESGPELDPGPAGGVPEAIRPGGARVRSVWHSVAFVITIPALFLAPPREFREDLSPMGNRAALPALAIAAGLLSAPALADQRPVAVETCLGCHGIENYKNAYPMFHVPKLAGQHAQYITDALKAYANGDRPHSTMHAQAATLSDEDIRTIASWFEAAGE